jgi:hypothetical protein
MEVCSKCHSLYCNTVGDIPVRLTSTIPQGFVFMNPRTSAHFRAEIAKIEWLVALSIEENVFVLPDGIMVNMDTWLDLTNDFAISRV